MFMGLLQPSYAQVKFWVGEFKRGRASSEDEARSGRPLDATDEEMCKKVRDLVYSDRRIQVEQIAQARPGSRGWAKGAHAPPLLPPPPPPQSDC